MNWNSWSDFWAMGGYGPYVWGSYGVALVVMALETVLAVRRRRQALRAATEAGEGQP